MTTAAQNIHDLCRKLLLLGNHFFGWLKAEDSSTACGTSTLKSPLLRAFSVPDVHPRPRKRLSRCTLNCGLESVKKPRTAGLCGRAAGACDCGPLSCAKIERPPPLEKPSCKVRFFAQNCFRKYRQKVTAATLFQTAFHPGFQLPPQMAHVRFHRRKRVHTRLRQQDRTQRLTRRNRERFRWGALSPPSERSTRFENPAWPGLKTANFAAFGSWSETLLKNAESLRSSDALMRVAVPKASRPRWAA